MLTILGELLLTFIFQYMFNLLYSIHKSIHIYGKKLWLLCALDTFEYLDGLGESFLRCTLIHMSYNNKSSHIENYFLSLKYCLRSLVIWPLVGQPFSLYSFIAEQSESFFCAFQYLFSCDGWQLLLQKFLFLLGGLFLAASQLNIIILRRKRSIKGVDYQDSWYSVEELMVYGPSQSKISFEVHILKTCCKPML